MKATLNVWTRKGFYECATINGRTVAAILKDVIPTLEAMPEELDGEKQVDWTAMTIEIKR